MVLYTQGKHAEYRLLERPRSDTMGISTNPEWLASLGLPVVRQSSEKYLFGYIPIDVLLAAPATYRRAALSSFILPLFNIVDKRISRSTTVAISLKVIPLLRLL